MDHREPKPYHDTENSVVPRPVSEAALDDRPPLGQTRDTRCLISGVSLAGGKADLAGGGQRVAGGSYPPSPNLPATGSQVVEPQVNWESALPWVLVCRK